MSVIHLDAAAKQRRSKKPAQPKPEPRAYTAREVLDMILDHAIHSADNWAATDEHLGRKFTVQEKCRNAICSFLVALDGCSNDLPGIDLKLAPHPEDKAECQSHGENWFEPGMEISASLHDEFQARIAEKEGGAA